MTEATPSTAGAFDLSGMAPTAPSPAAPASDAAPRTISPDAVVSAPLVMDITQANLANEMQLSTRVPLVIVLYSPKSLASQQAVEALEGAARSASGSFQLARVNVDTDPDVAAAFQAQSVPAAYAVLAGRPLPLFEGVPTPAQVQEVLAEVLRIAPELGVTGRLNFDESELEKPMPPAHQSARAAEEEGDWDQAIKAWKKVLASNPADAEAKTALARARFERRYERELSQSPDREGAGAESLSALADSMFASGDEEGAFNALLEALISSDSPEEKEAVRKQLVGLFPIATDPAAVKSARGRLATYLMV